MQCKRVETHRPGHGLAVGETAVGSHQRIAMARGHLDKIAQHPIVPDLQRGDPGIGAVFRLQRGNRAARIARDLPQLIKRMVKSGGNKAALSAFGRRAGHKRTRKMIGKLPMPRKARQEVIEEQGPLSAHSKQIKDPSGFDQTIAQLTQIAG